MTEKPLTYGVNVRLDEHQLAWLRVQAATSDSSVSEEIRSAVWAAIARDPHADDVVPPELLEQLRGDQVDDVEDFEP